MLQLLLTGRPISSLILISLATQLLSYSITDKTELIMPVTWVLRTLVNSDATSDCYDTKLLESNLKYLSMDKF